MADVSTLRGPVAADRLGRTLAHEHVFIVDPEILLNWRPDWDEDSRVEQAVARLTELRGRGIETIFDPTVIGLGRDIKRVRRAAEQVDINIVPATGIYTYDELPFFFRYRFPDESGRDPITDYLVRDITQGIDGTDIRAAFLKCAVDHAGVTPGVERVLRAVAATHLETGAPVMVHTSVHNDSPEQVQRIMRESGVPLDRLMIGHVGDMTDVDRLRRLADEGSILGMDRFGIDMLLPTDQRIETLVRMCELGYAAQMVLAQDASCVFDWFDDEIVRTLQPNWHYFHIVDDVIPVLKERGVTDEQLDAMLVDVPRRFISDGN